MSGSSSTDIGFRRFNTTVRLYHITFEKCCSILNRLEIFLLYFINLNDIIAIYCSARLNRKINSYKVKKRLNCSFSYTSHMQTESAYSV
jgi:hypothetical protein